MPQTFNIYCDESGHLEHDQLQVMVLGAVWCPLEKTRQIAVRLREIKQAKLGNPKFEAKWTKVSPARLEFYMELMDYFFDDDDLHFRALIVPVKSLLQHPESGQTHDEFYYKMYFDMLKVILSPHERYRIYLDLKDSLGADKVAKLREVLSNNMYDFSREIIEQVQLVRSHEIENLQLADLLIGAIAYANRGLSASPAKVALVARMRERSGYELTKTTLIRESKVNLFCWRARGKRVV